MRQGFWAILQVQTSKFNNQLKIQNLPVAVYFSIKKKNYFDNFIVHDFLTQILQKL